MNKSKLQIFIFLILFILPIFAFLLPLSCNIQRQEKSDEKFIQFYDPQWPTCQKMEPIVDRVKSKYEKQLRDFEIINVRTDKGKDKVEEFNVSLTPTFVILDKDDQEKDRLIGGASQEILEEFIDKNIE